MRFNIELTKLIPLTLLFMFFICLTVLTTISYGQQTETNNIDSLFVSEDNGKYGFIDKTGNLVIERVFDNARSFSEGLAAVEIEGNLGFIDRSGKLAIQTQYDWGYHEADFSEGMAIVWKDKKYGFINKTGEVVIELVFDNARAFSEGLAAVKIEKKFGYVDTTGKTIIGPRWSYAGYFSEDFALVATPSIQTSYNLSNKLDVLIIPPFDPKYVMGKMFFIDKAGKTVINLQDLKVKEALMQGFTDGLAGVKIENKWGFIDKTGKVVIEPEYESVWPFFDGLAKVQIEEKYGYIDKTGKFISEPTR